MSPQKHTVPAYLGNNIWPTSYTPDMNEKREKLQQINKKGKTDSKWTEKRLFNSIMLSCGHYRIEQVDTNIQLIKNVSKTQHTG